MCSKMYYNLYNSVPRTRGQKLPHRLEEIFPFHGMWNKIINHTLNIVVVVLQDVGPTLPLSL